METLAEKLRIIKGSNAHKSVDLDSLTNFPWVIMPRKLKAPEFVKYDGTGDPCAHLHMLCRKMAPYGDNHPLLCQIFPNSLTIPTATWYVRLEETSRWKVIANSFLEYYMFNTKITPDRMVLMRTEKNTGNSFQEYAQRWRELAVQMQPHMMENEMIKWFIDNLKPPYYEKMISTQVTHFASLILIGECIDKGIRSKKIMDAESLSSMVEQQVKRMISCKTKKVDVHMDDNASERPRDVAPAYATPAARPYQQQNQSAQAPNWAFNQKGKPDPPHPFRKENRKYTSLPMPMADLYAYLLERKCWKNTCLYCMQEKINRSISFTIDNMYHINFRI